MNTLDDKTIYVFVRGDLAEEQQLVQTAHAVFALLRASSGSLFFWCKQAGEAPSGEPCIVALDGGSSEKAINKTIRRLTEKDIAVIAYSDPDMPELGITAIATMPLTKEQALPLANYRLRRYSPPAEASAVVALDGQRGANASVAQETEHSVSNREVAGEIPAGSSSLSVNCS